MLAKSCFSARHSKIAVDSIVSARFVLTMADDCTKALEEHAVVSRNGVIVEVLPRADAMRKYRAASVKHLHNAVLMPGLINMHTHMGMSMLRGFADDMDLTVWLTQHIWPAEGKFMSHQFVVDGVRLALAEMIKGTYLSLFFISRCFHIILTIRTWTGGVTCCNDMYFYNEALCEVATQVGFRVRVGLVVLDFPTGYAGSADEYLSKAEALINAHKNQKGDLIQYVCQSNLSTFFRSDQLMFVAQFHRFSIAPHAPYTVCDANLQRCKEVADRHQLPIHIHLHETHSEVADSVTGAQSMGCHRSEQRCRPFSNLDRLGLVDSKLIAAHMTHLSDAEIERCGAAKSSVAHCPSSNLKLASGASELKKSNSNFHHDLMHRLIGFRSVPGGFAARRRRQCLHRHRLMRLQQHSRHVQRGSSGGVAGQGRVCVQRLGTSHTFTPTFPTTHELIKMTCVSMQSVPAIEALRMATINGARALGIADRCGSLEAGKAVDMIAVDLSALHFAPMYDVVSHLVYVADRQRYAL
jgi:5-methylthioadenosine/S-adenosylhomocysteine deaminase